MTVDSFFFFMGDSRFILFLLPNGSSKFERFNYFFMCTSFGIPVTISLENDREQASKGYKSRVADKLGNAKRGELEQPMSKKPLPSQNNCNLARLEKVCAFIHN